MIYTSLFNNIYQQYYMYIIFVIDIYVYDDCAFE